MSSGRIGSSSDKTEISIWSSASSSERRGENRGSFEAALAAQCATDSPSGSNASTTPMQPRRRLRVCSVMKTPRFSANIPPCGTSPGSFWRETAATIARRANSSRARRSVSERDGILGLFVALHHAQLATLFDAIVELAPKLEKVLRRGHECADHHQPQKKKRQRF